MTSNRDKDFEITTNDPHDMVRHAMWGLLKGVSAQRTFADMLVHSEGMDEGEAPSLEEVAHMVAGMAERLDLYLNHVKRFVFDQVGSAKP